MTSDAPSPTEALRQAQLARSCLDLTSLGDADSVQSTLALCGRAAAREPWTAAVCVWPAWVATARAALPAEVRVAAVANFPHGATDVDAAVADARRTADAGGQEVDLVLPWRALLAGDTAACARLVKAVRQATPGLALKLIIESGELRTAKAIQEACHIGLGEGVDMLKTSTGKTPSGADPQAAGGGGGWDHPAPPPRPPPPGAPPPGGGGAAPPPPPRDPRRPSARLQGLGRCAHGGRRRVVRRPGARAAGR
ncbi:MAG: deoxyribose-phosphate aldolase [Rubrivivax sp.]